MTFVAWNSYYSLEQGDVVSELEDLELHFKAARQKFPQIVDDIRPSLQKYCARMTGSVFDGEDVVQDTLRKRTTNSRCSDKVGP